VASSERGRLETATVQAAYEQHSAELYNFLRGVLRDANLAQDCLQATFVKVIESGHTAEPAALKGWLFRVAFNQAMEVRRREQTGERIVLKIGIESQAVGPSPAQAVMQADEADRVRRALERLPMEQQTVTRMRIVEQKKFTEIAHELQLPLGTVLTRMRLALEKLRRVLAEKE